MLRTRFLQRFALCIVAVVMLDADGRAQNTPFHIERLSGTQWRITVRNGEPRIAQPIPELPYARISIPGYLFTRTDGFPELPFSRFVFALPPDGSLEYRIAVKTTASFEATLVPFSYKVRSQSGKRNPTAPPSSFVRKDPEQVRQGFRQAAIELTPVLYDPVTHRVTWAREMTIDVYLHGAPARNGAVVRSLPPLEDKAFVNGSDAVSWSVQETSATGPAVSTPWYTPDEPMAKIRVRTDGMYRISKAELDAAGIVPGTADPRTFRMFYRGAEQPIAVTGEDDGHFDEGDYIEFYGKRRSGSNGEWFDMYEDDNVYFLRWNGPNGVRFTAEDARPGLHPPLQSYLSLLHLEEDHIYHFGDHDESDANETEYVFGEGWIWKYLLKKDSLAIPFFLPQLDQGKQMLTFRIKGSSRDSSRIRISLNNVVVEEFTQGGYDLSVRNIVLPNDLLKPGSNILVFYNVGIVDCPPNNPTCTIERFYVDWASIRYPRQTATTTDLAIVDRTIRIDSTGVPGSMSATLTGFRSSRIEGVNLDTWSRLANMSIVEDGGSFSASATIHGGDSYVFFTDSSVMKVSAITAASIPEFSRLGANTDYIIVTHAAFKRAAQRLANYRNQTDGYAAFIADVDDIYDAFNYGLKSPVAIRECVKSLYDASTDKKPRFLVLLGDASWDPKFHREDATKIDFIPTFGNPVSDNYYVAILGDSLDATPSLHVGRIPAETESSANDIIDKIIEYEQTPPDRWHNRMLYVVGGKSVLEQQWYLLPPVQYQIRQYTAPFCLEPDLILKKSLDIVSYDDLDSIVTKVDRGVLWFYFTGHGGTRIIDVGVERPDIFSSKGRYPFFLTMSCNTAHFAEPYETGLNERFLVAKENGAIASYGTSGLGEVRVDAVLSEGLHEGMLNKSMRTYGEISTYAKTRLLNLFGTSDVIVRNTVNQYIILGDPATHIPLVRGPELYVAASDITTSPEIVVEQQETEIFAHLHNAGTCLTDSVDVLLVIEENGTLLARVQKRIPPFLRDTVVEWKNNFSGPGGCSFTVSIDPDQLITELSKTNNIATISRNVLPRGITQVFPLDNALLAIPSSRSIEFVMANPSTVPDAQEEPVVEWQLSDSPAFSGNPIQQEIPVGMVFTRLEYATGTLYPGTVYYWRARLRTRSSTDFWSRVRSFSLTNTGSVVDTWLQTDSAQFKLNSAHSIRIDPSGYFALGKRTIELNALSAGSNQSEIRTAVLRVNGMIVLPTDIRGFNVAVVDGLTGKVDTATVFDTYSGTTEAARMTSLLESIGNDKYLLVAVNDDANGYFDPSAPGSNITPELRQALKRFGAKLIDSVGFRDSYALIGTKSNPDLAQEMYLIYGFVKVDLLFQSQADRGIVFSQPIGPSNAWDRLQWNGDLPTGATRLRFNIHPAGKDTILVATDPVLPGAPVDLSSISALRYPFVQVEAILSDSTVLSSPEVKDWHVVYTSVFPENGINSQVVSAQEDSLLEGEPLQVNVDVYNAGRKDAEQTTVILSVPSATGDRTASATIPTVKRGPDSPSHVTLTVPTAGLRGNLPYEVTINPGGKDVQYYTGNDVYSRKFISAKDGARPDLSVLFDGVSIVDNDYVSPKPVIAITLRDLSPLAVTDTSSVQLFLDGRRIWLNDNPQIRYEAPVSGNEKISIEFTPQLQAGIHSLSVSGKDASGNSADSIPYQVRFSVSTENRLDRVTPFPSPTRGPMDFTFRILGALIPSEARVKIYTLAGRLIREIAVPREELHIGFNSIAWDGRDAEGAGLANGTYFFKLIVTLGGTAREQVGRFAVLR